MVGDTNVGKTSLLDRYIRGQYSDQYRATIGSDFLTKGLMVDGKPVTLQLWDTAGQERFRGLGSAFYRGADGCIIVYDVTVKKTFESIEQWRSEFLTHNAPKDPSSFPIAVMGNKIDMDDKAIGEEEISTLLNNSSYNLSHYEVSSKDSTNTERAFLNFVEKVARSYARENEKQSKKSFRVNGVSFKADAGNQKKSDDGCSC